MKTIKTFTAIIFIATVVLASSCKKDEEETQSEPVAVTTCFSESYNGTYNGNGTINGTPTLSATVTLTKLSCTSCKLDAGTVVETIVSLQESADGGYKGKDEDGKEASVQLDGTTIQVNTDEISFTGDK